MSEIPRRVRIDQNTPAELAIRAAIDAVEAVGADLRLTDAVMLLGAALESVADYVDGVVKRRAVVVHADVLADGQAGVDWWGYVDPKTWIGYKARGITLRVFIGDEDVTRRCKEFYIGPSQTDRWALLYRVNEAEQPVIGALDRVTNFVVRPEASA